MAKQRIYIKLKAFDKRLLDKTVRSIVLAVKRAGSPVRGAVSLPRRIIKFTVNRSPHVDKKSREQFEMRIHKRLISLPGASSSAVQSLMGLQLPAGVDVELKLLMDKGGGDDR